MKNTIAYLCILCLLTEAIVMPWVSRQKALTEEELQIGTETFDVHHIRSQVSQYEQLLENFLTTDLVTMELPSRSEEEFIEEFPRGEKVKGFFIVTGESRKIDVKVISPSGNIIYQIAKANSESFELTIEQEGKHRFVFSNVKNGSASDVLTGIHFGSDEDQILASEHLSEMATTSNRMLKRLNEFQVEQKFFLRRQESHNKTVKDSHYRATIFSVVETVVILLFAALQVYFVKKLLSNRRFV